MGTEVTVADMVFSRGLVNAALATWPHHDDPTNPWHVYQGDSFKLSTRGRTGIPEPCRLLVDEMCKQPIHRHLNCPTAFPDMQLHGGGLHEVPPTGWVGRHTDCDRHPTLPWMRVGVSILFLNPVEGGQLVVDDRKVDPKFNRFVVFESPGVHHEVLPVRGDQSRKSICVFWWRQSHAPEGATTAVFS